MNASELSEFPNYCGVVRVEKYKLSEGTGGRVGWSLKHNFREKDGAFVEEKTAKNYCFGAQNSAEFKRDFAQKLRQIDGKPRADAVGLLEVVVTKNARALKCEEEEKEFLEKSRQCIEDFFGKDNVISMQIHLDESTPHIHAYVIPLERKYNVKCKREMTKLNAKKWTGGRKILHEMQDFFYKNVFREFDLDRYSEKENKNKVHQRTDLNLALKNIEKEQEIWTAGSIENAVEKTRLDEREKLLNEREKSLDEREKNLVEKIENFKKNALQSVKSWVIHAMGMLKAFGGFASDFEYQKFIQNFAFGVKRIDVIETQLNEARKYGCKSLLEYQNLRQDAQKKGLRVEELAKYNQTVKRLNNENFFER